MFNEPIDLRSDTVTRPVAGMRAAMAAAEVGDDVYREDPCARALEERVAALVGKEAALFMPSGTMANQVALLVHARPGDEVIAAEGAHCAWYESGAAAAWAGVQFAFLPGLGCSVDDLEVAVKSPAYYHPRTRLLALENTHNRAGGRVLPQPGVEAVAGRARALGLAVHLDGARLFNASVASGLRPAELARPADSVSVCLSKGLGAPVGSLLAGGRSFVDAALRYRKMLGGGMRQVGVLAAAGSWALDHHVERLAEDHENARRFAASVARCGRFGVQPPETNVVMIDLDAGVGPAEDFAARARSLGVLVSVFGPRRVRAVTHLDVTRADVERAAETLVGLAGD